MSVDMKAMAEALADAERQELEASAKAALPAAEYLTAPQLEQMTGTPASTWRYWAHIGSGLVSSWADAASGKGRPSCSGSKVRRRRPRREPR
jgi:hypothetical protein